MMRSVALCVLLFAALACSLEVSYAGYKVIRAQVTDEKQLSFIKESNIDVWSGSSMAFIGSNDMMVNADDVTQLEQLGVQYDVLIEDVDANIQREKQELASPQAAASWFTAYHTNAEILTFLANLSVVHKNLVSVAPDAGKSLEGRAIPLVQISSGKSANKKKILIVGGQHAREWIGPALVLYMMNKMLTGYGVDPKITAIVDAVDFTIVPIANPDGYNFTWTSNRLWRKNRRHNANGSYGVDLNRNWDDHWCESGGSTVPSSDTYCGTGPFSEPESKFLQQVGLTFKPFDAAFDFHSYGQLIMRPWGWTKGSPSNDAELVAVGDGMKAAIKANSGQEYTNQAIYQLYLSSGSSCDWFVSACGVPLSYGFEVRDTGRYGFQLRASEIIPTGEEIFAALSYVVGQFKN